VQWQIEVCLFIAKILVQNVYLSSTCLLHSLQIVLKVIFFNTQKECAPNYNDLQFMYEYKKGDSGIICFNHKTHFICSQFLNHCTTIL